MLLVFDGVDTVSSISLNGVVLGLTDNMFRRYVSGQEGDSGGCFTSTPFIIFLFCSSPPFLQDFPVTELLHDGENILKVSFLSPVLYASERCKAYAGAPVPPQCPPDVQKGECHVNFIRKVCVPTCLDRSAAQSLMLFACVFLLLQEQCSFSWDWGPSFPSMGLFRGVHIVSFDLLHLVHMTCVPFYSKSIMSLSLWQQVSGAKQRGFCLGFPLIVGLK